MKDKDLNLKEFQNFIKDKRCICFGAGIQGIRFINILESWGMAEHILAFTDNCVEKYGEMIGYEKFYFSIISIGDMLKLVKEDVVLIITCADFINVRLQLDKFNELENVYAFSLVELGRKTLMVSDYEKIVHAHAFPIIPKIIHYCWFGEEKPIKIKKNIEKWKKLCPDYEIIEWNDSNYNINKNLYTKQAYTMKKWGYVPDYIRLDLIYQYGGIYLDTDVEMIRRPDDLLFQDGYASFDSSLLVNLGSGFGAKAGGEIIKELRDYYDHINFLFSDGKINRISCMTHSYNVLKKYGFIANDKAQKIGDLYIYPMIFQGTCSYTRQMRKTQKTFFLHYGTMTWLEKKNRMMIDEMSKSFIEESDLEKYDFL